MAIVGIVLNIVALSLIYWLRKEQTLQDGLHEAELQHIHHGMNAMMDNFNNYQVETDRKIAELEKQLEIKTKQLERSQDKLRKDIPPIVGRVVGQIELAQDTINRKI